MELINWEKRIANLKAKNQNTATFTETSNYKCDKCKDLEYIIKYIDGKQVAVECECSAIRQHERLVEASGISETFKSKNFGNYEANEKNKQMKDVCMEYVKNKSYLENSLMILGNVGSGKTHLAMAITNNLLAKGVKVRYIDYRGFISEMKRLVMDRDLYNEQLDYIYHADIVYIDDFFKGKVTESDINIMFEIVNHMYLSRKTLIITSELDIDSLMDIDMAIASRLVEKSKNYLIISDADNYRLKV